MSNPPRHQLKLIEPGGLARRLRDARGNMHAKDLAALAGWQISKISKIEHGKELPRVEEDDLGTWARLTGTSDAVLAEWRDMLDDALAERQDYSDQIRAGQRVLQQQYNDLIAATTGFQLFEPTFVPRFLQLPGYTHAVLTESRERHGGADDVDVATAARQESLDYLADPARSFDFIITEATLGWRFAALPRDVHRAQLLRLLEAVEEHPHVRFGIIPLFQPINWVPQNGFQLFKGADFNIGVMEHWIGEHHWVLGEDVDRLNRVMDNLWTSAREGDEAREIIQDAIGRLDRAED